MTSLDEKADSANSREFNRLQLLIIGRLLIVFLLLVLSWIWYSGNLVLSLDNFPRSLFILFTISVGLTVVYFFLARINKRFYWQYWVQFIFDAGLITWLVWRTGDLSSPYVTLYFVLISIASIFLRPNSTLGISFLSVLSYSGLALLIAAGVIDGTGSLHTPAKFVQILSFNLVAMLVVGLLASRLSDRRSSGEQLKEAAKTLADLRALHERIVESIRSGLITTDLEGTIYTYNAAAMEITGRTAEEVIGRSIFEIFGNIREQIDLAIDHPLDLAQLPRFETDLVTPDGFAVRIGYSISQLFSKEDEPTGLIIAFQDLTQIRSMEESIRRKDRLAAVGRVGAGLAHEIRNPLAALKGHAQLLVERLAGAGPEREKAERLVRESRRLELLVDDLLGFVRTSRVAPAPADPAAVLRERRAGGCR